MFENILILESKEGEADRLESILGQNGIDVTVVNLTSQPDLVPKNAKELSKYEQVILVNIANSDLVADTMPENFDGELYKYVYDLGGSMFTVGGECDIGKYINYGNKEELRKLVPNCVLEKIIIS